MERTLEISTAALHTFRVQVKDGPQVRLSFDVLATSKTAAQKQHECLCKDGEQCVVYTPDEWELKRFQPRRLTAMELQQRQQDIERVIWGSA